MRRSVLGATAFVAISGVLLAAVGLVVGEIRFDKRNTYYATFSNINGLNPGDEVRAAGVTVGDVRDVTLNDDQTVRVKFRAAAAIPLQTSTLAAIRYKSLTGRKYLLLSKGEGRAAALRPQGVLPLTQSDSGLDLDAVFNSFKPLVQGLSPEQINQLSTSVIEVFEGRAGSLDGLMENLGALVSTLAERSEVIDGLITNFRDVLATFDENDSEFDSLVTNLRELVEGLARNRKVLVNALADVSDLAATGSEFVSNVRPGLRASIHETGRLAQALNSDLPLVNHYLSVMPGAVDRAGRLGAYGSFYGLYICGVAFRLTGADGKAFDTPPMVDQSPRCRLGGGR